MKRLRRGIAIIGVVVTVPFFVWLPLGWLGMVPTMVDVYGIEGLRVPASIVVGGLLIAALGFYEI
ncbi:MAG: hypothetical protein R3268_09280 [Acidiferrobacterales bacterium]|nr:hypothetical protein [Acidiferrobacterales bacterium]